MKFTKLLLICVLLMGTATVATADIIWFDADGLGGTFAPVRIDELSGEVVGLYDVITALGADGRLGDGDTFSEDFALGINTGNLLGINQETYIPPQGALFGTANLTGNIFDYTGPGLTTAANPENIVLDTFKIGITGGTVDFFYQALFLGSFDVVSGESSQYELDQNDTLTARVGISLVETSLAPNVWFEDNGGLLGADLTTLGIDPILFALADQSNNLIAFAGDDNGTPGDLTDDSLIVTVDDNGTDVEFTVVPEPTTMSLLGLGLLGLAAVGRRKRKV